ncbi:FhaA domain-containing protein [uncultured Ilumatobacter sp.]|uniref:FhaA domain-containing protein n=1 Tax=uncultured Ilumatobacter sp. TaxID=879968 RepID=UPI00374F1307
MGLQSIERRLERMVDGVFSRRRRGSIRPIELGRRLVREMDDNRSVDVKGRRIVPNDFTVLLSPADHASFSDIEDALTTELGEAAREYAREESYHFMGPVLVKLMVDNNLKPGRFGISSQLKQAAGGLGAGSLVLPSGERVPLGEHVTTVGRLPESTISINDANVSRNHAEIRTGSAAYVAVDLGSTNGTMVNGVRFVGEQRLNDGDIISFGSTHVRFEAS